MDIIQHHFHLEAYFFMRMQQESVTSSKFDVKGHARVQKANPQSKYPVAES
jgi:hypothetical protein